MAGDSSPVAVGPSPLEGGLDPERLVVIEFESVEAAEAWYDSVDYREIRAIREGAGEWRMVVVEGMLTGRD